MGNSVAPASPSPGNHSVHLDHYQEAGSWAPWEGQTRQSAHLGSAMNLAQMPGDVGVGGRAIAVSLRLLEVPHTRNSVETAPETPKQVEKTQPH